MRRWPQQYAPHFLFGLAEKKTGRARSKRKERLAQNLHVRAGLLKAGVFRIGSDKDRQSSTGSRRTTQLRGLCAAIVGLVEISGWLSKCLSF